MARISAVKNISINEVGLGSIFIAGDCVVVTPRSIALAIQRQTSRYNGNEGSFQAYPIYSRPIPLPSPSDEVHITETNLSGFIHVGAVDIISISSSSILQTGSNAMIETESRTKHIRQIQRRPRPQ
ncbi:spore germination protein GerPE [Paenibacillus hemerocallicola]|uniref:Spore germination protein GerPE n=1 Tax=Paenibacillus hemerocallicola TaxID=1172614 RepID=A0A5C4TGZ5_9BACL|nr:spore germination protein GerPE [Paenibacillus hemerocallicola]TNJ68353.1 spore germination protein GerPE [Paenibacillus hemerocallicola]